MFVWEFLKGIVKKISKEAAVEISKSNTEEFIRIAERIYKKRKK